MKGGPVQAVNHLAKHGWVSLAQLAALLDLTPQAVYQRSMKIPTVKVGATRRVAEEDVLAMLENARDASHTQVVKDLLARAKHQIARERHTHE